jgi:hypothetical protein
MPLEPETIELLLKQLERQVDELRTRTENASKFGNKLVGGLVVVSLVVGGIQFFVVRQISLLDAVRDNQRQVIERLIVLEVKERYDRTPHPDEKEKP